MSFICLLQLIYFIKKNGYRVLGCASRSLKISFRQIDKIERSEIECNLTFLGFLIMENKLKPITSEIIYNLQQANIRTIMVTGKEKSVYFLYKSKNILL